MKQVPNCYLIVAATELGGIGKNNQIPWNIKEDMQHFVKLTTQTTKENGINAIICGRKTFESFPKKPLLRRKNVVISKEQYQQMNDLYSNKGVIITTCLDEAIKQCINDSNVDKIFIIGGSAIYNESIKSRICTKVYLTKVLNKNVECDTFIDMDLLNQNYIPEKIRECKNDDNQYEFWEYTAKIVDKEY